MTEYLWIMTTNTMQLYKWICIKASGVRQNLFYFILLSEPSTKPFIRSSAWFNIAVSPANNSDITLPHSEAICVPVKPSPSKNTPIFKPLFNPPPIKVNGQSLPKNLFNKTAHKDGQATSPRLYALMIFAKQSLIVSPGLPSVVMTTCEVNLRGQSARSTRQQ